MKNVLILPAIAVLFMLSGCGQTTGKQAATTNSEERVEVVKVAKLEKTTISKSVDFKTTLEGYEQMNIAPSMTGKIEHIYVEVGSKVNKGDNLVRMDQNQYKTATLTYNNLVTEFERVKALRETGSVSQQTYDQTKLQLDQAKESLDFLEQNTYVKAQFQGVISAKNYEDGELYSGQAILTLTQINTLKAFISVPETYFPIVKEGMKAVVSSSLYDMEFTATIETVYPTIDPSSHTFQVKLRIPNGKELLRPGMYVNTTLALGEIDAIVVPYQSVLKLQGSNNRYVYANDNGRAKYVAVELGQRFDDKIEIISDELSEGDELVVVGQARLIDGVKLDIQ